MEVPFTGPYITLAQFLKKLDYVSSGGEVKIFLEMQRLTVNGELETRRGRKLVSGDRVLIDDMTYVLKGRSDAPN